MAENVKLALSLDTRTSSPPTCWMMSSTSPQGPRMLNASMPSLTTPTPITIFKTETESWFQRYWKKYFLPHNIMYMTRDIKICFNIQAKLSLAINNVSNTFPWPDNMVWLQFKSFFADFVHLETFPKCGGEGVKLFTVIIKLNSAKTELGNKQCFKYFSMTR